MDTGTERRNLRKAERHAQILLELRLAPHVRVSDLAASFDVTTETVRRDIAELSAQGLLQKSYGGASPRAPGAQSVLDERQREHVDERRQMAQLAAKRVTDGQTLMIDAGATMMEFARALTLSRVTATVLTNSLQVAMILGASDRVRVVMTPGDYMNAEAALTGTATCDFLRGFNVDACFLGASALDETGVSEAIAGFAEVKRAMLDQSRAAHFLIDASKFGKRHLTQVTPLEHLGHLITDAAPKDPLALALRQHRTPVITPENA